VAELSPAAQAVINATAERVLADRRINMEHIAAAALRAAADQVVPIPPMIVQGGRTYEEAWTETVKDSIRQKLFAIAAELEVGR